MMTALTTRETRQARRAPGRAGIALVGCLWVLLSTGCAVVERDQRAVALQNATNGYQSALRWGYRETAIGFLEPELRQTPAAALLFENTRVTGYDVLQPPVIQADETAIQIVRIDYLKEDTQVVKSVTDRQLWRWDDARGAWYLASGLPPFGPEPAQPAPGAVQAR